ncbi:MAG TPA: helix-turn-helix domain-containing protein [Xanthobacteraceae bacterium]|jgi:hypothetical protein|nr:helix-turn-helix domain-containing protein [Xanthobacteraceae bacterium]
MRALKARSQNDRILAYLVRGHELTTYKAFERFHCCRLSERIRELKARGHRIVTERARVHGTNIAKYRLVA